MGASGAGNGGAGGEAESRLELETSDPRKPTGSSSFRSRRQIPLSAIILILTTVVLLGAAVGYFWYDKATKVHRENPGEVLQQYLNVRFNNPVPGRVELFVCEDPRLTELESVLDELKAREKGSEVEIEVGIEKFTTESGKNVSTANAELYISYSTASNVYRESLNWRFTFIEQNGWRLCEAHKE
ncbi:hypothetical protein Val02_86980 [Virgisporangium aliadipatigenens]|uniref:Uncharacterized protein n=1 Tax=Virgisporangium aliadipatigenens TaxID=741659 RepID=A0A8J3YW77_9ACTN|nr:hypothetical protein [Virgisporangium aliadipatigenens]GIJ51812.1 hypothetical protein Val02_86980 [Virgisporangium aliadipatigenens]